MKVYHFTLDGYGEEYTVMAEDKVMANQYIINYLKDRAMKEPTLTTNDGEVINSYEMEQFIKWADTIFYNKLPEGYTFKSYDKGEVIQTEIS
jgi:hypothetical protein